MSGAAGVRGMTGHVIIAFMPPYLQRVFTNFPALDSVYATVVGVSAFASAVITGIICEVLSASQQLCSLASLWLCALRKALLTMQRLSVFRDLRVWNFNDRNSQTRLRSAAVSLDSLTACAPLQLLCSWVVSSCECALGIPGVLLQYTNVYHAVADAGPAYAQLLVVQRRFLRTPSISLYTSVVGGLLGGACFMLTLWSPKLLGTGSTA